jgi:ZIP family zinc transporter
VVGVLAGDRLVERRFGDDGAGGALGIVVGSMVGGVPESIAGIATVVGFCLALSIT